MAMKYIRTKDGIYKTREYLPDETIFENKQPVYQHGHINKKDIINQAETIEELIDELVVADKKGSYHLSIKDERNLCVIAKNEDVYGAIWTDKGLIYVAKMNEKGDLELL